MSNLESLFEEFIKNLCEDKKGNIKTIDIFPKVIESNDKYWQVEKWVLQSNKYNFLDKYYRALINLYMYEEDLYFRKPMENEIEKDTNDLRKYIALVKEGFDFNSKGIYLVFSNLNVAISIAPYQLNLMYFQGVDAGFIESIFKAEGLFIV